jgi:hypothetical protein
LVLEACQWHGFLFIFIISGKNNIVTKSKKSPDLEPYPDGSGSPEQNLENQNIDQALKQESKDESYPELVNDAQEREVFDTKKNDHGYFFVENITY